MKGFPALTKRLFYIHIIFAIVFINCCVFCECNKCRLLIGADKQAASCWWCPGGAVAMSDDSPLSPHYWVSLTLCLWSTGGWGPSGAESLGAMYFMTAANIVRLLVLVRLQYPADVVQVALWAGLSDESPIIEYIRGGGGILQVQWMSASYWCW